MEDLDMHSRPLPLPHPPLQEVVFRSGNNQADMDIDTDTQPSLSSSQRPLDRADTSTKAIYAMLQTILQGHHGLNSNMEIMMKSFFEQIPEQLHQAAKLAAEEILEKHMSRGPFIQSTAQASSSQPSTVPVHLETHDYEGGDEAEDDIDVELEAKRIGRNRKKKTKDENLFHVRALCIPALFSLTSNFRAPGNYSKILGN